MARQKVKAPRSERRTFGRLRQFRSGRWKASYTGPDGRLYEATSTFGAKVDAEAWLTDRRREIDRELWSPPADEEANKNAAQRKKAATIRFDEYAPRWLAARTVKGRPLKPRTVAHYQALLDDHLVPAFGTKVVRDISMESVDAWYAALLPTAPTLKAHTYSLLRTILETARTRDRIITTNPCLVAGGGTTDRKIKPKPATLDELDILTAEMPEAYRLIVPLSAWCALRFGELVELRRSDVDVTGHGFVKIRRGAVRVSGGWIVGDPKSDAGSRDVQIPPHILPAVRRHLAEYVDKSGDSLLFPPKSGRGNLQPSTLYRWFYKARTKAGRGDLRFHDLRGTGATYAAQTGATLAELMGRLGHSTPQAAMKYQHIAEGRDRILADNLSKLAARAKGL